MRNPNPTPVLPARCHASNVARHALRETDPSVRQAFAWLYAIAVASVDAFVGPLVCGEEGGIQ